MHNSVFTVKENASKGFELYLSMFLTSFNIYLCLLCIFCVYMSYLAVFGTSYGFFGEDRLATLLYTVPSPDRTVKDCKRIRDLSVKCRIHCLDGWTRNHPRCLVIRVRKSGPIFINVFCAVVDVKKCIVSSPDSLFILCTAQKQDTFSACDQNYTFVQPALQTVRWS